MGRLGLRVQFLVVNRDGYPEVYAGYALSERNLQKMSITSRAGLVPQRRAGRG